MPDALHGKCVRELDLQLRSNRPLLYVVSHEEARVMAALQEVAAGIADPHGDVRIVTWDVDRGFAVERGEVELPKAPIGKAQDTVLPWFRDLASASTPLTVLVLKDFHKFLGDGGVGGAQMEKVICRQLRNLARTQPGTRKAVVLLSPRLALPEELTKACAVVDWPLPERLDIRERVEGLLAAARGDRRLAAAWKLEYDEEETDAIVSAFLGLTDEEIPLLVTYTLQSEKRLDPRFIASRKRDVIRKAGAVEWVETDVSLDDVGGVPELKDWIRRRKKGFTPQAKAFGLPFPKGVLLMGVQGSGKSVLCKAVADEYGMPLLRLDMGRVFGRLLGESEANVRMAFKVAEAVAPCVLAVDEIEKGVSSGGGETDGGTSDRVKASLLTWMAEKTSPVFVMACVTGDCLVWDHDGVPRPMAEVAEGDRLVTRDFGAEEDRVAACDLKVSPIARKARKVQTDMAAFVATHNHPVYRCGANGLEMAPVEGLEPGDEIARPLAMSTPHRDAAPLRLTALDGVPQEMTRGLAQLLGYLMADGSFVQRDGFTRVSFNDKDLQLAELYQGIAKGIFGRCSLSLATSAKNSNYGYIDSKSVGAWIRDNFPEIARGKGERHVPRALHLSSDSIAGAFLRGFFDGDGTASCGRIACLGANPRMIGEVAHLLQRLGVGYSRDEFATRRGTTITRLTISSHAELGEYCDRIGFGSAEKSERAAASRCKRRGRFKPSLSQSVPVPWGLLDRLVLKSGKPYGSLPDYSSSRYRKARVSRARVRAWLDALDREQAEWAEVEAILNLGWSRVRRVDEVDGPIEVFDVRVPSTHNYVGNGLYMHNTANKISALPPELLRKGRFDESFFVDLPTEAERAQIAGIHLAKRGRDASVFDLGSIARATEDFSGADLEETILEGMYRAMDAEREVTTQDVVEAAGLTVPLARTMSAEIAELRSWASGRVRSAADGTLGDRPAESRTVRSTMVDEEEM